MAKKISEGHTCKTPSLMLRGEGSTWRCDCGARYKVTISNRKNILGQRVGGKYWLQIQSGRR